MALKALPARKHKIARGITELPLRTVLAYRDRWQARGFHVPDLEAQPPHSSTVLVSVFPEKPGTVLTQKLKWIEKIKVPDATCNCANLAAKMDAMGCDWCEGDGEAEILDGMTSNALALAAFVNVPASILGSSIAAPLLRFGAKKLLWSATAQARADSAAQEAAYKLAQEERRKNRSNQSTNRKRGRTGAARSRAESPPVLPVQLYNRRNLAYHIYPRKKERWLWQWNCDQILKRIDLFNGKRVVAIVHDAASDTPDEVKEYLAGHDIDFIVARNDRRLGENITAIKLMEAVQSFEHEVTFRAHAKGVSKSFHMKNGKYTPSSQGLVFKSGEAVQDWTRIMYETNLDYWDLIRDDLEKYAMTGAFKRHADMNRAAWYYSGSFYWFEHTRFYQRNWRDIDPKRYGVESLPGTMFNSEETGCVFGLDPPSLYQRRIMDKSILPQFHEWKLNHVPNRVLMPGRLSPPRQFAALKGSLSEMLRHAETRPSDINEHVHSLRTLASRCQHVTEFGVRCGVSTVALIGSGAPVIRSYDINRPPNLAVLTGIVPAKTDWKFTQGNTLHIDVGSTDMIFIDTLHEYSQLSSELAMHGNKSRQFLVFHDTVTFGKRGELGGEGLLKAIDEFQKCNPHWQTIADFKNCNGLMVLRRRN